MKAIDIIDVNHKLYNKGFYIILFVDEKSEGIQIKSEAMTKDAALQMLGQTKTPEVVNMG